MDVAKVRYRRILTHGLKIAVSVGVLYWLIANLNWVQLEQVLRATPPAVFLAGVALLWFAYLAAALRWWLLLRRAGVSLSLAQVVPSYLLGIFFNQVLPSSVGGDAVRTYYLSRRGLDSAVLVASALIDRYLGFVAVMLMAGIVLVLVPPGVLPLGDAAAGVGVVLLVTVAVGFVTAALFSQKLSALIAGRFTGRIGRFFAELWRWIHDYHRTLPLMVISVLISFLSQGTVILCYGLYGNAAGIELQWALWFAIVPFVMLAQIIPLAVAGIGIKEAALTGLLVWIGAGKDTAVIVSILMMFAYLVSVLPGGVIAMTLWLRGDKVRADSA